MSREYQLTREEKQSAIRLAHIIQENKVNETALLQGFEQNKQHAKIIMDFWSKHSEITKLALNKLIYIKCKKHLECCYQLDCSGHNEQEN